MKLHRHGRTELRRLPGARRIARSVGRRQRLCRQGPVGRPRGRAPAQGVPARSAENIIVGNTVLYGAIARRSLFRGRRRRALRGAQLGRGRRRRGHRRSWLRIHDRRRRGRAGRHRAQLRGRHVGRRRLCLRSQGALQGALQSGDGRARSSRRTVGRPGRSGTAAPALARASTTTAWATCCASTPSACASWSSVIICTPAARGRASSSRIGTTRSSSFVKVMPKDYKRALCAGARAGGGESRRGGIGHGPAHRLSGNRAQGSALREGREAPEELEGIRPAAAAGRGVASRARAAWIAAFRSVTTAARSTT